MEWLSVRKSRLKPSRIGISVFGRFSSAILNESVKRNSGRGEMASKTLFFCSEKESEYEQEESASETKIRFARTVDCGGESFCRYACSILELLQRSPGLR